MDQKKTAEQFGPSWPPSSNAVAGPLKNVTEKTSDKRFTTYVKSNPRRKLGVGELAAQLRFPVFSRHQKSFIKYSNADAVAQDDLSAAGSVRVT